MPARGGAARHPRRRTWGGWPYLLHISHAKCDRSGRLDTWRGPSPARGPSAGGRRFIPHDRGRDGEIDPGIGIELDGAGILIRVGRWLRERRNLSEMCNSPTESRHSAQMVGPGVEPGCPLYGSSAPGPPHLQSGPTPSREIVPFRGFNVDRATRCSGNTGLWEMVAPWATRRTTCAGSTPR